MNHAICRRRNENKTSDRNYGYLAVYHDGRFRASRRFTDQTTSGPLARHANPNQAHIPEVATNRRAPADLLDKLASDSNVEVKIAVATNVATNEKTFMKLAADPDKTIRSVVARFEFVPASVLDKLATDPEPDIRLEVVQSFNVSESTLQRLTQDEYPQIRELASQILANRREQQ